MGHLPRLGLGIGSYVEAGLVLQILRRMRGFEGVRLRERSFNRTSLADLPGAENSSLKETSLWYHQIWSIAIYSLPFHSRKSASHARSHS